MSNNDWLVLLVQDEPFDALQTARVLREHEIGVLLASTGREALEKVQTLSVDLALVDLALGTRAEAGGSEDAVEVARRLDLPVIFLAGSGDSPTLERAADLAVYGCLPRTTSPDLLLAAVQAALRLHQRFIPVPPAGSQTAPLPSANLPGSSGCDLRALLYASQDLVSWHDPQGQVLWVSPSVEHMTGYSVQECLAMTDYPAPLLHPDDRPWIVENLERIRRDRSAGNDVEFRLRTRAGSDLWVSTSWAPIYDDPGGQYLGTWTSVRDITERKLVEESLQKAETLYRTVLQIMPDGVAVTGLDGRVQYASERMVQLFHFDKTEDLIGKQAVEFILPQDRERAREDIDYIVHGQPSMINRYTLLRADGSTFTGEIHSSGLYFQPGRSEGMISVTRDISDRQQVEQNLRKSQERYQLVFEHSGTGNAIFDCDLCLLLFNSLFIEYLGLPPEEVIGQPARQVFGSLLGEAVEQVMHEVFTTGKPVSGEAETHVKGGKTWLRFVYQPLFDFDGTIIGVQLILRDVTEARLAQEKVSAALHEKETLLRELYHRTRNNMQVISALLNMKAAQSEDEQFKRSLLDMDSRIRSMALVHQKLYQSQNLSSIDLKEYLAELSELVLKTYQTRPGQVNLSFEGVSIPVVIDTAIPCGLLVNEILANTLKYAFPEQRQGEVQVRLQRAENGEVILEISDNGVGFAPGVNLAESRGLGMQIIQGLANHQLGGRLELESSGGVRWRVRFRTDRYRVRI